MDLPEIAQTSDGPMALHSTPQLLRKLLLNLEAECRRAGIDVDSWLKPGIDESEVRLALSGAGLSCPDELVIWYGWHNGHTRPVPRTGGPPLPRLSMMSVEEAVDVYTEKLKSKPATLQQFPDFDIDHHWGAGSGWLRLDQNVHGVAIDCSLETVPPRVRFPNEDFQYETGGRFRAVSLCTYVTWQIYGLRQGGFKYNVTTATWDVDSGRLAPSQQAASFF